MKSVDGGTSILGRRERALNFDQSSNIPTRTAVIEREAKKEMKRSQRRGQIWGRLLGVKGMTE